MNNEGNDNTLSYSSDRVFLSSPLKNETVKWDSTVIPSVLSHDANREYSNITDLDTITVPSHYPVKKTEMIFKNISVSNISLTVESYSSYFAASNPSVHMQYFQEIKIPGGCYLPWVSLYIQYINWVTAPLPWNVTVYNATGDLFTHRATPQAEVAGIRKPFAPTDDRFGMTDNRRYLSHWENISLPHVLLNTSNTYFHDGYYHFFVSVIMPILNTENHFWFYAFDNDGLGVDYGSAFAALSFLGSELGLSTDQYIQIDQQEIEGIDFTLITKLVPVNNTPTPSSIGLDVNGAPVQDIGNGTGSFESFDTLIPDAGIVEYKIKSDWSDLSPGSLKYDLELNYTFQEDIKPAIDLGLEQSNSTVQWSVYYNIKSGQTSGNNFVTLTATLPLSWTNIRFYNITNGSQVAAPFSTQVSPTGKYRVFSASNVSKGDWKLIAKSSILVGDIQVALLNGSIDINDFFIGNLSVTDGPNGKNMSFRSDHEGGLSSMSVIGGHANSTLKSSVLQQDNRSILYYNYSTEDYEDLTAKANNSQYLVNTTLSDEFELYLNLPEGFLEKNIKELSLILDQGFFNSSWWFGFIGNASMPENPNYWINESLTNEEATDRLISYDRKIITLNYSYNQVENRYSDMFFNFTATASFSQNLIDINSIYEVSLEVASNFSKHENNQSLFVKNQSSGTFIKLNSTLVVPAILNDTYLYWNSSLESSITNITQFINPANNTLEFMVRTENTTEVNLSKTSHVYHIDVATLKFNYHNSFSNFSMLVYNWTSGNYSSTKIEINSTAQSTIVYLDQVFSNVSEIFNESSNSVLVKFEGNSVIPLLNLIWWNLDRIMLNLTFTYFVRCSWNQSIYSSDLDLVYSTVNKTLFESVNNNLSVNWTLKDFISKPGSYKFQLFWDNGTHVMIDSINFTILPFPITLAISEGADFNNVTGKWRIKPEYAPYVNDTSKSIIIYIEDAIFNNPVSGGSVTFNWTGPAINVTDLYIENQNSSIYAGRYKIQFNTTGLSETKLNPIELNITFSKSDYIDSSILLLIDIRPLPVSIVPSGPTLTMYENESISTTLSVLDSFHQLPLQQSLVTWHLKENESLGGSMTYLLFGVYQGEIDLHGKGLSPGNYTVVINVTGENIETITNEISLIVLPKVSVLLDIIDPPGISKMVSGDLFSIGAKLSLENGSVLSNQSLVFEITFTDRDNRVNHETHVISTNSEGIARFSMQIPDSWISFSYAVMFEETGPEFNSNQTEVSRSISVMNKIEYIGSILMDNIYYILIAIALIVLVSVARYNIKKKKERIWKEDADKIRDIVKIQHLLVIMKNSGACVVNRSYSPVKLDADLIAGFLQAIATFGKEVGPKSVNKKDVANGMIFDYQNFKILVQDGNNVRVALILDGIPTDNLKRNVKQFIDAFESRYKLDAWKGNLEIFRNVDILIENAFEITLIYPLIINPSIQKREIKSSLGKALYEVALAVQKEKQAFYLSTLLNYAQAGRKESQNQVLSEIYHLKKQKVFQIYHA
ncbi:MAG: hypothetical protein ACTSYS_09990 [Promethearchaeota archaeon]